MFIYHGRKLSISDELLSKYRHHIGNDLSESWADLYVHNKYIHQSDEPLKLIPQLTDEELLDQGIKPNTIRLSIGTENVKDLIAALDAAFEAIR